MTQTTWTPESRELALCEINESSRYKDHMQIAREDIIYPGSWTAYRWTAFASKKAAEYHKEFETNIFSSRDILLAALELQEYYKERLAEEK